MWTSECEVVFSEDVCVFSSESAGSTKELGLAGPVSFVDVAAVGAALAGVRGVHLDHRHSGAGCFVGEESAELGEGPAGVCGALGLAEPYPFADTGQFFDRYPASTPRVVAKSPDGHVEGVCLASGNKAEGGLVVAFLYHVLKSDPDARAALVESGSRSGYSIVDKLTDA